MSTTIERTSIPLRVPVEVKKRAEYAASLRGESLNGFISGMLAELSEKVIEQEHSIKLTEEGALKIADLLANPPAPNEQFLKAATAHRPLPRE